MSTKNAFRIAALWAGMTMTATGAYGLLGKQPDGKLDDTSLGLAVGGVVLAAGSEVARRKMEKAVTPKVKINLNSGGNKGVWH